MSEVLKNFKVSSDDVAKLYSNDSLPPPALGAYTSDLRRLSDLNAEFEVEIERNESIRFDWVGASHKKYDELSVSHFIPSALIGCAGALDAANSNDAVWFSFFVMVIMSSIGSAVHSQYRQYLKSQDQIDECLEVATTVSDCELSPPSQDIVG